ncbi:hypothetical protein [Streptomyces mirabilis]
MHGLKESDVFRHQGELTSGSAAGQDAQEGARAFADKRAPHPARPLMPATSATSAAFPPQPVSDFQEQWNQS